MSPEATVSESQAEILEAIERYRLLTSRQVRDICSPEVGQELVRRRLVALHRRGLLAHVPNGRPHHRCWYLTPEGHASSGSTRRPLTVQRAAGPLQAHDLAVNEVGIAFLRAARPRGHEVDWRREVVHRLGSGQGRGPSLFADALIEYRQAEGAYWRFLELDRGSELLAQVLDQIAAYARLWRQCEGKLYAGRFPRVLFVLTGRPRPLLERRLERLAIMAGRMLDPGELPLSLVLLEDLQRCGPFAPIFVAPGMPERVDWLGSVQTACD